MAREKTSRNLDPQGRVLIPAYIREKLDLSAGQNVEITVTDDNEIILRATADKCQLCGKTEDREEGGQFVRIQVPQGKAAVCHACAYKIAIELEREEKGKR